MEENVAWYPLRVTYSREMKVKAYLDEVGVESFLPMYYKERTKQGKTERVLVPVINNLLFVRSTRETIDDLKVTSPFSSCIRYLMNAATHKPLIIPAKQMYDFMAVSGRPDEQIMYLSSTEVSLKKGDRVRVISGIWKGVEGRFVRIKRGLRVVVNVEGVMAVATASLHPSSVMKLED